jgi:PKD repeat protein
MRQVWVASAVCLALATAGRFALAASPVITSVDIDRTLRVNAPGQVCFDEKITVRVTDSDSCCDLFSVTIVDSGDPPDSCTLMPYQGTPINTSSVSFVWTKRDLPMAPRQAPYTFSVVDWEGNADTLASDALPAMPDVHMSVVAPAMDGVISQVVPTLQWQNTNAATEKTTRVDVYEEALQNSLWYRNLTDGSTSVLFGNGGTARYGRRQLLTNHSYVWTVRSGTNAAVYTRPGDPVTGYHRIIARDWQELHGRFAVYGDWSGLPSLPSLPGKLAYSAESIAILTTPENWGVTGILGYNTDPAARVWLGPEMATDPDWSPDGNRLLYATPMGLYVDDFSGASPVWVPGTTGADAKCRWAPDGERIIFGRCPTGDSYRLPRDYELWITGQDGTDAYPILDTTSRDICLSPSPDGEWIAYESWDGGTPSSVRLVRYDGSEDHPVVATGVWGQDPMYAVTSLAQPSWSPDGVTLAVVFQAGGPALPALVGVGTLPVAGGPVHPLFISPYFYDYAAPLGPFWSPDGTAVAFSSGHHRPDLSGYDTISAAELWMVNADGSSLEPVRLTEDYSLNRGLSWWGMNTPAGENVSFRRGDVTLIFSTVTAAGVSDVRAFGAPTVTPPPGLQYLGGSYGASTTALYAGPVTVEVRYLDADLPAGEQEGALVLLHWENGQWVDITIPPVDGDGNIVRGACDSLGTFALAIASAAAPVAAFTAAPVSGQVPLTVHFSDSSSGDPSSWSWDFGDGATSDEQSPSYTYTAAGSYDVTLTVANGAGSDSVTNAGYIIAVTPPPVADFVGAPVEGTVPLTVSFTDLSAGATTWAWSFGDGATSSDRSPSHAYATEGTYDVSLTASNDAGADTCAKAGYITVHPVPPAADFMATPTSGVVPLTVSFTDQSTGVAAAWAWDFGDGGSSTGRNPVHTYAAAGTYTVSLMASNSGGASTCTKTDLIVVLPVPLVASFTTSVPTAGCAPLAVSFTDTSSGPVTSWLWEFGDGSTSALQNPTHVYAGVGTYTVSLTVSNTGGSTTATAVDCVTTYQFIGPLPPVDPDGDSSFKPQHAIQVRIRIAAADGSPATNVDTRLFVGPVAPDGSVAGYAPAVGWRLADNAFQYDRPHSYFEFPLDGRNLSDGVWSLRVTVNGQSVAEFRITITSKSLPAQSQAQTATRRRRPAVSASPTSPHTHLGLPL